MIIGRADVASSLISLAFTFETDDPSHVYDWKYCKKSPNRNALSVGTGYNIIFIIVIASVQSPFLRTTKRRGQTCSGLFARSPNREIKIQNGVCRARFALPIYNDNIMLYHLAFVLSSKRSVCYNRAAFRTTILPILLRSRSRGIE